MTIEKKIEHLDGMAEQFGMPAYSDLLRANERHVVDAAQREEREKNAREQADTQFRSIAEMVAALECDYKRLEELRNERENWSDSFPHGWAEANPDDAEELSELEAAAGDILNHAPHDPVQEARERIQEDPLEIEMRSGWYSPNDALDPDAIKPEKFRILLCTGGPAVRIVGELDESKNPRRAWLEYQDCGTPWIERTNQPGDMATILAYCRCFYFGG